MVARLSPLSAALPAIWYGDSPWRWPLWPLAAVYRALVRARRECYRRGWLEAIELPVPVIVVGNLSVGGTGKTPFIIWLADHLLRRGLRVGIVTRGYRGRAQHWPRSVAPDSDPREVGDEPVLLARRTRCAVAAGPDRVAAARHLLAAAPVDVLLSDDGLQHYRLARQIEIAVVDGARGMGNGLCLPAGPLREPVERLREVDAIVVNGGSWGHAGVFRARAAITSVYRVRDGAPGTLESFAKQTVHAVAGIGNPQRFFDLLEDAGLEVDAHPLADHAELTAESLRFDDGAPVLMTEKDAVKCETFAPDSAWCVTVDLAFDADPAARLLRVVTASLGGL
jgi:tetraacyldisaccharide 4'-kinase